MKIRTLRVGVKNLTRVGKGIQDVYLAFLFGAKLTILGATKQSYLFLVRD